MDFSSLFSSQREALLKFLLLEVFYKKKLFSLFPMTSLNSVSETWHYSRTESFHNRKLTSIDWDFMMSWLSHSVILKSLLLFSLLPLSSVDRNQFCTPVSLCICEIFILMRAHSHELWIAFDDTIRDKKGNFSRCVSNKNRNHLFSVVVETLVVLKFAQAQKITW